MNKNKSFFFSFILSCVLVLTSVPLMGWDFCLPDFCSSWNCCDPLDLSVDAKVAYYIPNSKRVRKIYGHGWADYQLEVSKGIFCDWRIWAGVSGFSKKGESLGFHDDTRIQLIPLNFGVRYYPPFFPCNEDFKFYVGAGASYSFLRIHDDAEYVNRNTHKNGWGGLIQMGVDYTFWQCAHVGFFADYCFQNFHFHDSHHKSSYGAVSFEESGYVEKYSLDMGGYKLGVGFGYTF